MALVAPAMAIRCGWAFATFGTRTVSMPFSNSAVMFAESTSLGSSS